MYRLAAVSMALALAAFVLAQSYSTTVPTDAPLDYVCPMDPGVRSATPGKCSRCGMTLVFRIPDPVEYPLNLKVEPHAPQPGRPVTLTFEIKDPNTGAAVKDFEIVHEKLFHMFIVSQDLEYFIHEHPVIPEPGVFRYQGQLPKPGMYRVLADFYPSRGTPQLTARTIFVPGGELRPPRLSPDLAPKHTSNMEVELTTEPSEPIAGSKTMLFFHLKPAEGLQKYIGAWAHMLAASDDLVDLIHTHPFLADGGPQVQFNVIFPRARTYRMWVQFQRNGVVNTAVFTIPVSVLK